MIEATLPLDISDMAAPTGQLLTTKLYAPRLRANRVSRPRLISRLNQNLDQRKLTLISAPTGFGKTSLVSEWLYHLGFTIDDLRLEIANQPEIENRKSKIVNLRVAWLSLDKDDNDPVRFLTYVVAALQTVQPEISETSLAILHTAQPPPLEAALTALLNEIAAAPVNCALVLDDYHIIETETIHRALTFLLDHLPVQLQLVLLSRTSPPLSLGHLRARGELLELHAPALRFTSAEAAEFLNQVMGLNLAAPDIQALETRTEGWIAGLQLAALSMQGRDAQDIPDFLAGFSGGHRYILDYLAEEVLQRQPEAIQTFLLETSLLDRLSGPLCDAILGKDEGGTPRVKDEMKNLHPSFFILEELERANLFIMPLDDARQWYRYHPLFADLLRNALQKKVGKAGVATLHGRAAEWFEQQGLSAEAMSHALAAADVGRATRLVEQNARTLLSRSEMTTLLSWLDALPAELVRSQSQLSLFQAWALTLTGQLDAVETYLQRAERHPGEAAAIRATVAYFRRDMSQAIALYRQALATLPADNLFLRGAVALSLGMAYFWHGDIAGASQALTQASAISQMTGNLHVALTALWNLIQLEIEQGHLRQAAELCHQALQLASPPPALLGENTPNMLPPAAGAYVGLGALFYEQNDLDAALRHLEDGLKLGEQGADLAILAVGYLSLARIKQAQADPLAALQFVRQAEQLARRYNSPYWIAQAAAAQARIWIVEGQLEAARGWAQAYKLEAHDALNYLYEVEYITLARLLIAEKRAAEAATLLERLRQPAEAGGRMGRVIEALALQALAQQAQGHKEPAISSLQQALALAEPEGYIRLFLDEGAPMIELLSEVSRQKLDVSSQKSEVGQAYVNSLLAVYQKEQEKRLQPSAPAPLRLRGGSLQALIEPLSEREQELLRLVATGMSNNDIAEKLVVTVGTVKWHLNNIYGKLDVGSRTQAVARARELGLL